MRVVLSPKKRAYCAYSRVYDPACRVHSFPSARVRLYHFGSPILFTGEFTSEVRHTLLAAAADEDTEDGIQENNISLQGGSGLTLGWASNFPSQSLSPKRRPS